MSSNLEEDFWRPVNLQWWEAKHENCGTDTTYACEPLECLLIYIKPEYEAVCSHEKQCIKVPVEDSESNDNHHHHDDGNSGSSSSASLLAGSALLVATALVLN